MAKYFNQTFSGRRPSTYQTPPSNMSQRYTPSYGMSSGPVVSPSWARSSGNSISEYNPRGVNRAYNAPRSMSRAPVLDMKTDGTFKIMNYGTGKSLPGYKGPIRGLPGTGIGMGKIMSAFGRMAGFSRRANPYLNALGMAFDLAYDFMAYGQDWAKIKDANEGYPYAAWGFSKICDIGLTSGAGGIGRAGPVVANPGLPCGTGGVVPTGGANAYGKSFTIAANHKWFAFGRRSGEPAARMVLQQQWSRPASQNRSGTFAWQQTVRPIGNGEPNPAEISISENGPSTVTGRLNPYEREAITATFAGGRGTIDLAIHTLRGVDDGEREKKGWSRAQQALALLSALYDATTEAKDIVDILYDNLGRKCKGAKSMSDKAYCVWKNLDTLDYDQAVADLIQNHMEDKLYGRIYGTVGSNTPFGSMNPGLNPDLRFPR